MASITNGDRASVSLTYVQVSGQWQVQTVTDRVGATTTFAYNTTTRTTTVTNALGQASGYGNDAANRLVTATNALGQTTRYAYDAQGNLSTTTDALGRVTTQAYDSRGNLTLTRDAEGRTVTYTYDAHNRLVTETAYLVADPDGDGTGEPGTPVTSRYAYDAEGHLRFTVSAEGRVTEYRYNTPGQRIAAISYTAAAYNLTGLTPTTTLSEAQLQTWVGAQ
ncbi:MAG: hypothetical protein M0C28_17670 [Candidatus Moduliflexus flocculans]|nr:hypothetical protein [Candidatus Moduliflexus flocculans]